MSNYAELIGRVDSVDFKHKGWFNVYTEGLKKQFKVECSYFCPVAEGDAIFAIVSIEADDHLKVIRPPFVQIATDKDSILRCFIRVLRGSGFGNTKAHMLFDKFASLSGSDKNVTAYISELANNYIETRDDDLLYSYSTILSKELMKKLLVWWHKQRSLRRLYLFGLTNREIENCKISHDEIYNACLTNPYKLPAINLTKCDEILGRQNKTGDPIDRRCGEIVRKIWFYMDVRGWSGVPSNIIASQFPDYTYYKERLEKDFGVVGELFTIYLKYPHMVEKSVSEYLSNLVKSDFDGDKIYGDPHFSHKTLTEDQKNAVSGALKYPVSVITGSAGSGKTMILGEIIHNLEIREIPYAVVSFTGKAVARIREVTGRKTPATMHRLISRANVTPKFKHLIIDEASMVTTKLFYQFIQAFPDTYNITFVGDCNQLQPIEWGSLFEQIIKSTKIPVYRLTKVHRIKGGDDDGIGINSRKIIEYSTPAQSFEDEDEYDAPVPFEFTQTPNFTIMPGNRDNVCDIVKSLHSAGVKSNQVTIVTPYNKDIDELNKMFQQIYLDNVDFREDSRGKIWKLGDRIMMIENNYDINVMNGEEGTVTDLEDGTISVTFSDGASHNFNLQAVEVKEGEQEEVNYNKTLHVGLICHAYAVTIHRAQGSEWEFVIVYIPSSNTESNFLSRNMIYTAITRGKKMVWCLGDVSSLTNAAQRAPSYRCDNLNQRIVNHLS